MTYPGEKDINVVHDQSEICNLKSAINRKPLLSILTPAVFSRWRQLEWLCSKIERQIGNLAVEHLILLDNKRRTVGEKRDALLRAAKGDYVAYVDDDDDISEDYVQELVNAIDRTRDRRDIDTQSQAPTMPATGPIPQPDVITFLQKATVNGQSAIIEFKLGNGNEPFTANSQLSTLNPQLPIVKRSAWHICAWKRSLAIGSTFPPINYGEDWAFAEPLCLIAETSVHIDKVLHYYRHDSTKTEAPPPGIENCKSQIENLKDGPPPEHSPHPAMWGDAGPLYKKQSAILNLQSTI